MATRPVSACPGCGLELAESTARGHAYIGASPACWALHAERTAVRTYESAALQPLLQVVVDSYAVQHPGEPGRRSTQSVALHLMTLQLFVEEGADPRQGSHLHKLMIARLPQLEWLDPPEDRGRLTTAALADAHDDAAYERLTWEWAHQMWSVWEPHHATVRAWNRQALG